MANVIIQNIEPITVHDLLNSMIEKYNSYEYKMATEVNLLSINRLKEDILKLANVNNIVVINKIKNLDI
jgi:hypothetical protein